LIFGWEEAALGCFSRRYSTSLRVPDAFVDGGEGFLVFVVEDGSGIFKGESLCLRHSPYRRRDS